MTDKGIFKDLSTKGKVIVCVGLAIGYAGGMITSFRLPAMGVPITGMIPTLILSLGGLAIGGGIARVIAMSLTSGE